MHSIFKVWIYEDLVIGTQDYHFSIENGHSIFSIWCQHLKMLNISDGSRIIYILQHQTLYSDVQKLCLRCCKLRGYRLNIYFVYLGICASSVEKTIWRKWIMQSFSEKLYSTSINIIIFSLKTILKPPNIILRIFWMCSFSVLHFWSFSIFDHFLYWNGNLESAFGLKFRNEECTRCGTKGGLRYIIAPCHGEQGYLHCKEIASKHTGQAILEYTGNWSMVNKYLQKSFIFVIEKEIIREL